MLKGLKYSTQELPMLLAWAVGASLALPVAAADEASITSFSSSAVGEPAAAWKFATLPNKTPTKFAVVELAGARVLKVEADESYGNLAHAVRVQLTERSVVNWRWRVDKLLPEADITVKAGEDSPAKLCLFFAFDAAKLSFGERTKLSLARTTTGQDVPTQTLCYVWDNKQPIDSSVVSPFTRRIRVIVLQSGDAKLGQWVAQRRNMLADYQRMFGDESEGKAPELVGVAVSADADNTHGHSLAYFGDVMLTP